MNEKQTSLNNLLGNHYSLYVMLYSEVSLLYPDLLRNIFEIFLNIPQLFFSYYTFMVLVLIQIIYVLHFCKKLLYLFDFRVIV